MRSESDGKCYVDWFDVENAALILAKRLQAHNYQPRRILAVARGGLIPATMLSHILGVRQVFSIQLESYSGEAQEFQGQLTPSHWETFEFTQDLVNSVDTLIVDDLFDTGKTHEFLRENYPDAVTCCLFYKEYKHGQHSQRIVSFPGSPLPNQWIVFPWERLG